LLSRTPDRPRRLRPPVPPAFPDRHAHTWEDTTTTRQRALRSWRRTSDGAVRGPPRTPWKPATVRQFRKVPKCGWRDALAELLETWSNVRKATARVSGRPRIATETGTETE